MVVLVLVQMIWRPFLTIDRIAGADRLVQSYDYILFRTQPRMLPVDNLDRWAGPIKVRMYGEGVEKWRPVIARHLDVLSRLTGMKVSIDEFFEPYGNFFIYIVKNDQMAKFATRHTRDSRWISDLVGPNRCIAHFQSSFGKIEVASTTISSELTDDKIERCLIRDMTRLLGLIQHSGFIRPSIFSLVDDHPDNLTINDRILVRAHYDGRLRPGMPRDEVMKNVRQVIAELVIEARNGAAWSLAE